MQTHKTTLLKNLSLSYNEGDELMSELTTIARPYAKGCF